ncbi:hypothetical protein [Streptomyces sp. DH8]|uniref:hypothetical protein n=1 Tax=Streptomyces sp. DH8 TaxID=2857008 RepID=UPI001E2E4F97|nr:hypothetical protein [Streptomyces sp. DH8]
MDDILIRLGFAGVATALIILFFLRAHRLHAWVLLAASSILSVFVTSHGIYRVFHVACAVVAVYAFVSERRRAVQR